MKKLIFVIIITAISIQANSQVLNIDQLTFLNLIKTSLENGEIYNYIKENGYIENNTIYILNKNIPLEKKLTIELKNKTKVVFTDEEVLFFHSIRNFLSVTEYEIKEHNARLVLNILSVNLKYDKGWQVSGWSESNN